jgi:2-octaprenylphenol hydroxylase
VRDYHQCAVCCTVVSEKPHGEVARQRFLETGPLAFLPLCDPQRSAIVWSTQSEAARLLLRETDHDFRRRLTAAFDSALGAILETGPRTAFPLVRGHASRYTGERVALIGDAAHRIHPLAGQGANLGLMDAATLAEVLQDAHRAGLDLGELRVLRRYERWRKGENTAMMLVMDVFKEVFGTGLAPVRLLRNLGLSATDAAIPLKRWIMRRAAGLEGDLPRLALETARVQGRRSDRGGW